MSQAPPTDEFIFDEYKQGRGRSGTNSNASVRGRGRKKDIRMKRKDFFNEHQRLIALLGKTADKLGSEAKDQYKEMMSYRKKGKGTTFSKKKSAKIVPAPLPDLSLVFLRGLKENVNELKEFYYTATRRSASHSERREALLNANKEISMFNKMLNTYYHHFELLKKAGLLDKAKEMESYINDIRNIENIFNERLRRNSAFRRLYDDEDEKDVGEITPPASPRDINLSMPDIPSRPTSISRISQDADASVKNLFQPTMQSMEQEMPMLDESPRRRVIIKKKSDGTGKGRKVKGGVRNPKRKERDYEIPLSPQFKQRVLNSINNIIHRGDNWEQSLQFLENNHLITDEQIQTLSNFRSDIWDRTLTTIRDNREYNRRLNNAEDAYDIFDFIETVYRNDVAPSVASEEYNEEKKQQQQQEEDNRLAYRKLEQQQRRNLSSKLINSGFSYDEIQDVSELLGYDYVDLYLDHLLTLPYSDAVDELRNALEDIEELEEDEEDEEDEDEGEEIESKQGYTTPPRSPQQTPSASRQAPQRPHRAPPAPQTQRQNQQRLMDIHQSFDNAFDELLREQELEDQRRQDRSQNGNQERRQNGNGKGRKVGGSIVDSFIASFNVVKELHSVIDSFSDYFSDTQKSYFKNFSNTLNTVGKTVKDIEKMNKYVNYAKSLISNIYSTIRNKDLSAGDKFASIVESIGKNIPKDEDEDKILKDRYKETLKNLPDDSYDDDDFKMSEEWKARMREKGTFPRLSPVEEGNEVAEQDVGEDAVEPPSKRQKLGEGKPNYALHTVVIHKPIDLEEARRLSRNFIKGRKKAHTENEQSYRFRNIPKTQFKPRSFRTKVVNPQISLIYGELKDGSKYIGSGLVGDFFSGWIGNLGKMAKGAITGNLGDVIEGTTGMVKDAYDTIRKGVSSEPEKPRVYDPSRVKKGKGVIGDLYKKAKEKVKKAKERFRVNPFSLGVLNNNYCGPFTQLEGQPALSATDSICKTHDYAYNDVKKAKEQGATKEQLARMTRDADNAMLESLKGVKESSWGDKFIHLASTLGISGKVLAEDLGLLDPTRFSASGKGEVCSATGKKQCLCHLTGKGFTDKLANWIYKNIVSPYFSSMWKSVKEANEREREQERRRGYGATVSKPAVNIDEIGDKHRQLYDKYSNLFANEKDEKRSKDYLGALNSLDKTHLTQQQLKELEDYNYLYKTISGGAPPRLLEGGFMGEIMSEMMSQMFEKGLHKGLDYVQNNPAKVIDFLGKLK